MTKHSNPPSNESPKFHPIESVADLLRVTRSLGLNLRPTHLEFDRSGLDFLVVHALDDDGAPWIVRTPRRPDVLESSRVEARVLELVRRRLPVAVPDWRVVSGDVIAYPRLAGTPAVSVHDTNGPSWNIINPAALPEVFLDSFARALAAMQAITTEEAQSAGVPTTPIVEVRRSLRRAMEATRDVLCPSPEVWRRWTAWLEKSDRWPTHLALVHGDLHPGHMLLDPDGRLNAILDWTEARVTDPTVDFAMFCGCFGVTALKELVSRFERADGKTWPGLVDHAVERWAMFPVVGAEWALRVGNEDALELARSHLRVAVDAR